MSRKAGKEKKRIWMRKRMEKKKSPRSNLTTTFRTPDALTVPIILLLAPKLVESIDY